MNEHDQLAQARELIQQRRFTEARQILQTVSHPTAQSWLQRIDEAEFGDPFADSRRAPIQPLPPIRLDAAADILISKGWKVITQSQNVMRFSKKQLPSRWIALLAVLVFSLLGSIIVCLAIATGRELHVTLEVTDRRTVVVRSDRGTSEVQPNYAIAAAADLADTVKNGVNYGEAILLGICSMICWWTVAGAGFLA
ncbi:MAG: hypothetical protein WA009_13960 [Phototrophicaceae bacterium]